MAKIVKVNHPKYGETELNVERVIAVVQGLCLLLFENVVWSLEKEEFDKVYEVWKEL